ncbi:GNAT family N-acetyltransferase [Rhodobacteraceae bacterium 2CG4]|uniref:GNAT family N-acetyltransferase n=1 Tax=Halovulum marinum TaxID=2662447 RepID=A0A6L5YZ33_9RHOB|nr:GNAT family N-acetyltransferase [Halovulum marinum]MSU89547.1 GNAT family N-acetyltransferase [Halovulum marinum]
MTPEALAALHASAFSGPPRPWTAEEFAGLLADPGVLLLTAGADAFLLARIAGPEAEVLTLCTAPSARRRGLARRLLDRLDAVLARRGVEELYLEVAETNAPARALYAAAGFTARGHRKDYYSDRGAHRIHALVLGKPVPRRARLP